MTPLSFRAARTLVGRLPHSWLDLLLAPRPIDAFARDARRRLLGDMR